MEPSGTNQSSDLNFLPPSFEELGHRNWELGKKFISVPVPISQSLIPRIPGGITDGVTPLPIPNREVKPIRANGTVLVTVRESRSLPGFSLRECANR